jgi:hypothetical protein
MRNIRWSFAASAVVLAIALVLPGCSAADGDGNEGAPGATCTPTAAGADACDSGICGTVECVNSMTQATRAVSVCVGDPCTTSCGHGEKCVNFPNATTGYCVPESACS